MKCLLLAVMLSCQSGCCARESTLFVRQTVPDSPHCSYFCAHTCCCHESVRWFIFKGCSENVDIVSSFAHRLDKGTALFIPRFAPIDFVTDYDCCDIVSSTFYSFLSLAFDIIGPSYFGSELARREISGIEVTQLLGDQPLTAEDTLSL